MAKANIRAAELSVELTKANRREALQGAFAVAMRKARSAVDWYEVSIKDKRRGALTVRLGALFFGALATLTPIVLGTLPEAFMKAHLAQLMALPTIFAAFAGGLVILDRFFGFSSGWMRYLATYMDLQVKIETFEIQWARRFATLGAEVTDDEFTRSLDLLASFLGAVSGAVRTETREWIASFQGALAEIDQSSRGLQRADVAAQKLATAGITASSAVAQDLDIVHVSIAQAETRAATEARSP